MLNIKTELLVPQGLKDIAPLPLPMSKVYQAEARVMDIATCNEHKAPELMAIFNDAFLHLSDLLAEVEMALRQTEKAAAAIRSVIILDRVPGLLAKKGVASSRNPGGSEDQRQAVLDGDVEYQTALDAVQQVKCIRALLQDKRDGIRDAYSSAKKILGDSQGSTQRGMVNRDPRLSAGEIPANATPGQVVSRSSWGKPKF